MVKRSNTTRVTGLLLLVDFKHVKSVFYYNYYWYLLVLLLILLLWKNICGRILDFVLWSYVRQIESFSTSGSDNCINYSFLKLVTFLYINLSAYVDLLGKIHCFAFMAESRFQGQSDSSVCFCSQCLCKDIDILAKINFAFGTFIILGLLIIRFSYSFYLSLLCTFHVVYVWTVFLFLILLFFL
jgi:hypothetical protein